MSQKRQRLAREFNLETEKQAKPIVRAEDELVLLQTLWSSPSLTLDHERLRVQLALIAQLAGITGNRPGALLALRYSDLKITLFRDTCRASRPNITLDFTFHQTKSYRGPKDPNTFAVPEVCNDSCLPCCPQVVLLGLFFGDNAFANERLTGPDKLFSLRVPKNLHSLSISIKESLAAVPVFRAVTQDASGYMISPTAQATANWLRQQFKPWGEATGFDVRQPTNLSAKQREEVDQQLELRSLQRTCRRRATQLRAAHGSIKMADGTKLHSTYQALRKQHHRERKTARRTHLKRVKKDFRKQQALADVERQLNSSQPYRDDDGCGADVEDPVAQSLVRLITERRLVYNALFTTDVGQQDEDRMRRAGAIDAVASLCKRREPHRREACLPKEARSGSTPPTMAYVQCPVFTLRCSPTQCIFCLGNIELAYNTRTLCFRDYYSLRKHFQHAHLNRLPDLALVQCPHPSCTTYLRHKEHLQ
ncbi:hypothetical protein LTR49_021745 [Elasticomyces elasticus]|nr:hypothetical protein LTR49_021745 [Elasticomyces elasticus]